MALLRGTHCVYCRKALGKFEGGQKEPSGEAALAIAEVMLGQGLAGAEPAQPLGDAYRGSERGGGAGGGRGGNVREGAVNFCLLTAQMSTRLR